ncbi:serine/threonine-protein kinase [Streptomyces sp. NRRL S-340]|uniref:serine/threonine-protein kinase n=1 Tax=Streptomyces sp. NRRL S-340 TaxID=1463901 RepID=UPI00055FC7CF|nr:serine/threonine-protein kinase [Streptomyces sp. NRRL S-340]
MDRLGPGDPREIGAYRLLARLGAGGMGQVYLARSDRGRTAAVKVVRQDLAQREEFRARFRQEVRAARRVGGTWTAPVLDADTEAAVPWVATGYVAGPSLQRIVGHDHGPLPERSVRVLAAGLAAALRDIHAAGLVHRDLKPSNVLVTIDGPRVIDFGIARALETVTDGGLTRTGALVGSPGFMAPEQVRGDRLTPACDVFCLGSVLAYAATGTLPFGTADSGGHALMFRIAQEEPDLEALPEGVVDLVRACLRKDPAARPSPEQIIRSTGAGDTVGDGRFRDPWLPSALVAQLGRHAVRLLDAEHPEEPGGAAGTVAGAAEDDVTVPAAAASQGPSPQPPEGPGQPEQPEQPEGREAPEYPAHAGNRPGRANRGPAQVAGPATVPVSGAAACAPPPPRQPGDRDRTAADRPPAVAAGRTPPPGAAPAHPAPERPTPGPPGHGTRQHGLADGGPAPAAPAAGAHHPPGALGATPPPGALGATQAPGALGATPPYGHSSYGSGYGHPPSPPSPYDHASHGHPLPGPGPLQEQRAPRGGGTSTAALLAVALVVALGAGGSVYAVMRGGHDDRGGAGPSPTLTATGPGPSPTASGSGSSAPSDGAVPAGFLGTWRSSIDSALGAHPRRLTIRQGRVGDPVFTLVADGPTESGGTYHCVFEARLTGQPGAGGPLEIGPSTVAAGPGSACKPGAATQIVLLPDGGLQRINKDSGERLTYDRTSG